MFTGLVEDIGKVKDIKPQDKGLRLTIETAKVAPDLQLGDSVAVNGICLTVVNFTQTSFETDVMHETLKRTSLYDISVNATVNVERAMQMDDRFGGHIVSGHIDGVGEVSEITADGLAHIYRIEADPMLLRYIIEKGSVALDGTSLTIVAVDAEGFSVSLIPHTLEETIFHNKKVGSTINIEVDLIGKYIEKLMFAGDNVHQKTLIDPYSHFRKVKEEK